MDSFSEKMAVRAGDGVGWMLFNHTAKRNAIALDMWEAIPKILAAYEADDAVRVCVISGIDAQAFVSGADITDLHGRTTDTAMSARLAAATRAAWQSLDQFPKPLIAMIQGFCFGAGVAIAAKADLRIAAPDARFSIPAARLALAYPLDLVRDLVNLVGPATAKSLLFTGRRLDAAEALRLRLVDEVVDSDRIAVHVGTLAATMVASAPLTQRAAKAAVNFIVGQHNDIDRVNQLNAICAASRDHAEGVRAFIEKRTAVFTGQ